MAAALQIGVRSASGVDRMSLRSPALLLIVALLSCCSSMRPQDFAAEVPRFEPEKFFEGHVRSWGVIETRSGNPRSRIRADIEGQRQYVQFIQKALVGVAASDGKLLWQYNRAANPMGINCSTPIYHEGKVFAASAYGAGGALLKLSKGENGGIKAEEVYFSKKMQNHHGGMIVLDGALYGANGGNEGGALVCLDFQTGNVLWDERDDADHRAPKGSVAMADGRLYYRTEKGTMLLIEPNQKQYIERGHFDQPDRSEKPAWSHPVIANGKLYVRDQDLLLCYDVKARGK